MNESFFVSSNSNTSILGKHNNMRRIQGTPLFYYLPLVGRTLTSCRKIVGNRIVFTLLLIRFKGGEEAIVNWNSIVVGNCGFSEMRNRSLTIGLILAGRVRVIHQIGR
jgi:hypothetical protein